MVNVLPWKALRSIRQTFEIRYMGIDAQPVESWLKHIVMLMAKKTQNK